MALEITKRYYASDRCSSIIGGDGDSSIKTYPKFSSFYPKPNTLDSVNQSSVTFDVTDNKPTDDLLFYTLANNHIMSDVLNSEEKRLKTFDKWPLSFIDKSCLAQTGMFFTGVGDKVKCYFCEVEIGQWEETDNEVSEHMRWSPNCPLLRRRTTNNIPMDAEALDRVLPPPSYDVCGANDLDIRPAAYAESTIFPTPSNYYPEHPEYITEAARLRSFNEWPRNMKQRPNELSEAGFFYTGVGDRVKCFSCGGGLKDWDVNDEPWEEHAMWFGSCNYVKLIKGQSFIDSAAAKYQKEISDNELNTASNRSKSTQMHVSTSTETQNEVNSVKSKDVEASGERSDEEKRPIAEEKLCKICYAAEYNTAFLPCGHVVACAKCASSVTKCPMCRKPFTNAVRVFFS